MVQMFLILSSVHSFVGEVQTLWVVTSKMVNKLSVSLKYMLSSFEFSKSLDDSSLPNFWRNMKKASYLP